MSVAHKLRRHWQGMLTLLVLGLSAFTASQVNSHAGPPASVFVPWPEDVAVPRLVLRPMQSQSGRWSLELEAEGFAFSEICKTVAAPETIGHAHIYSGDRKIAAAYAPRIDLGFLVPGRHRFRAVLRAQDHRALIGPDGLLEAEVIVAVR